MTGPDRNRVGELLVAVVLRRAPKIKLRANALNVGREHSDIVALPFTVIQRDCLFLSAPFDS